MKNAISLLLSPNGRLSRPPFWAAFLGVALMVAGVNLILQQLDNNMTAFWIMSFFPFIAVYMFYCLFSKRLHDIGRSAGFFWGLICVLLLILVVVMLSYGGAEYFSEFSKFDRKDDIDAATIAAIKEPFEARLAQANIVAGRALWAVIILFTLWTGLSKPKHSGNPYTA